MYVSTFVVRNSESVCLSLVAKTDQNLRWKSFTEKNDVCLANASDCLSEYPFVTCSEAVNAGNTITRSAIAENRIAVDDEMHNTISTNHHTAHYADTIHIPVENI